MKFELIILFSLMSVILTAQYYTPTNGTTSYPYNEKDSYTYLYVSTLAYCDINKIKDLSCGEICNTLKQTQKVLSVWNSDVGFDSLTYVITYDSATNSLITAFRGTTNPVQLIDELTHFGGVKYELHPIGDAQVDAYFYDHYKNDLRSQFLKDFNSNWETYKSQVKKVVFTGHSLGAATTLHALADLLFSNTITSDSNQYSVQMYNFGQPRVGDSNWNSALLKKLKTSYRVVHNRDAVAHVPPCNPLTDFNNLGSCKQSGNKNLIWYAYHQPQEIWYSKDFSSYKICDPVEGEDMRCSNSLINKYSIPDHQAYFGVSLKDCKFL